MDYRVTAEYGFAHYKTNCFNGRLLWTTPRRTPIDMKAKPDKLPSRFTTYVIVTDREGVIRFVSYGLCESIECVSGDLIGMPLAEFLEGSTHWSGQELDEKLDEETTFEVALALKSPRRRGPRLTFTVHPVQAADHHFGNYLVVGTSDAVEAARPVVPMAINFERSYQGTSLSFERAREMFDQLETLLRDEHVYRDPAISISSIARSLKTNTQYLSQVVNFFGGVRFSRYVNQYRLNALARRLRDDPELQLDEVWSEAGFGSYSAFYRALRRNHAMAPTKFHDLAVRGEWEKVLVPT